VCTRSRELHRGAGVRIAARDTRCGPDLEVTVAVSSKLWLIPRFDLPRVRFARGLARQKLNMEQQIPFSPFVIRKAFSRQSEGRVPESSAEIRLRGVARPHRLHDSATTLGPVYHLP
jgi:hypothetical protein